METRGRTLRMELDGASQAFTALNADSVIQRLCEDLLRYGEQHCGCPGNRRFVAHLPSDQAEWPMPETSGTGFYCFAMTWYPHTPCANTHPAPFSFPEAKC